MSKYDYRDPGQDPAYCDGLAPDPEDEEMPDDAPIWLCRECERPCPAGTDVHESCAGFRRHLARGGTLD